MIGFVVVNIEVLVARYFEQRGGHAPGLDFIRWRAEQLREEVADDAEFWGIPRRDIALTRAAQLAEVRLAAGRESKVPKQPLQFPEELRGPIAEFVPLGGKWGSK